MFQHGTDINSILGIILIFVIMRIEIFSCLDKYDISSAVFERDMTFMVRMIQSLLAHGTPTKRMTFSFVIAI